MSLPVDIVRRLKREGFEEIVVAPGREPGSVEIEVLADFTPNDEDTWDDASDRIAYAVQDMAADHGFDIASRHPDWDFEDRRGYLYMKTLLRLKIQTAMH